MKQKLFKNIFISLKEEEVFVIIILIIVGLFSFTRSPFFINPKISKFFLQQSFHQSKSIRPHWISSLAINFENHIPYDFSQTKLRFTHQTVFKRLKNKSKPEFEKWFHERLPQKIQKKSKELIPLILLLCEKYKVDPFLVISLIWVESNFNHEALSVKNAHGLMQLMPKTKYYLTQTIQKPLGEQRPVSYFLELIGGNFNAKEKVELVQNLELGIYYLSQLHSRFQNSNYAIVAYNMGPSFIDHYLSENKIPGSNNRYLNKIRKIYHQIDI